MTRLKQFVIKETILTTVTAVITAVDARDAKLRFKKDSQTVYQNFESETQTEITAVEGEK
ncbi:hypothetical protein FCT18_14585 [Lysinibacillus sphaericus]|uniref:Uncharacterized protein n=1 Tax=Lysinibacillus sphaericus TaxID=1421 RepID=A0A2S0K669_LYSSH|nr:hypothetical protein [Lysinibacillus sphaericus]AVK98877.1 hypothetical protein LS41612_22585 [Lysinibacillus sphaericus]MED4545260.1 hypothetical protein [Lysinibacillus sphaericus]TKI18322.1 hypothetical protein FCT18_14585 [Lysinibacillus sphaericus]SUV15104.1 Uncharacterised protein [Lysinibacillus sphaericus]GEC82235.1 hypothetical protein LSP03_19780 [Lysinibacillus sphaericus]